MSIDTIEALNARVYKLEAELAYANRAYIRAVRDGVNVSHPAAPAKERMAAAENIENNIEFVRAYVDKERSTPYG